MKLPNITARSRWSPHRTTGGTGTRRTWTLASAGALRRRPPRPLVATWRTSSTSSSRPLDARSWANERIVRRSRRGPAGRPGREPRGQHLRPVRQGVLRVAPLPHVDVLHAAAADALGDGGREHLSGDRIADLRLGLRRADEREGPGRQVLQGGDRPYVGLGHGDRPQPRGRRGGVLERDVDD